MPPAAPRWADWWAGWPGGYWPGALAIPGIGPVLGAGVLGSLLTGAAVGAAAGGLMGGLVGLGIPEEAARAYESHIKAGRVLLTVLHATDPAQAARVRDAVERAGAYDARIYGGSDAGPRLITPPPPATVDSAPPAPDPAVSAPVAPAAQTVANIVEDVDPYATPPISGRRGGVQPRAPRVDSRHSPHRALERGSRRPAARGRRRDRPRAGPGPRAGARPRARRGRAHGHALPGRRGRCAKRGRRTDPRARFRPASPPTAGSTPRRRRPPTAARWAPTPSIVQGAQAPEENEPMSDQERED